MSKKIKTKKRKMADIKKQVRKAWDIRRAPSLATAYYEDLMYLQQESIRISLEIDMMF